ncbi:MAG: multidrug transporter [Candidatus Gallionella acididurans]|uniref:Multidrug transporter n=1 Tax=Candidatus Gallionella acididurans TaxID=1796491 RepID=A0A139BX18_9PROT|nr:MAG: multidrug transporter [Candidatus Gallionella acididurans]
MRKIIFGVAALLLAGVLAFWIFHKPANAPAKPEDKKPVLGGGGKPMPVQAAMARAGDIDVYIDGLGTVTALNTATVKARVNGLLEHILFREGQTVKKGAVLAQIDPRPFQVILDQARGQLAHDQALLAGAKLDLDRYRVLWAKDSIAKQQVDDQEALVLQDEGTVLSDRAQVANAQLNVDFTRITAPLSGRLGIRQVDSGNMVSTTDINGVVVVTQIQPIYVLFAIPADNIPAVLARVHAGNRLSVDVFGRENKTRLATGKLLTLDNQINVTTGTVMVKAEFANTDENLFPNQFVNARLRVETRHNAILAPTAAIQRGTQGTFVYVVGRDQTVSIRPVTLGPVSGDIVAIEHGLAVGEQVVTDGTDKLRAGAKIEVTTPSARTTAGKSAGLSPQ